MNNSRGNNTDELKEIHTILLQILDWYHNFCVKKQLRYYVLGGTLLGAVRHHGFIPWDDDVDVGMPRRDYERFITLMAGQANGRYIAETADKNIPYFYPFAKLYDTHTTLIEQLRYPIKRGIYIDIFPLDGIGDDMNEAEKNYAQIYKYMNLLLAARCVVDSHRVWYKNAVIPFAHMIFPTQKSVHRLVQSIENICKRHDFDTSAIVGNLVGAWGKREFVKREYFGTPKEYKFESITVYGVEQPDKYLTHVYGDYMQLPPEEKRVSHHSYIYRDLHKSYLD